MPEILVAAIKTGDLRKKKQREKQNLVEFDSDGSIESAEDDLIK